jgi:NitT/TauT family transport system substrate-binding protein
MLALLATACAPASSGGGTQPKPTAAPPSPVAAASKPAIGGAPASPTAPLRVETVRQGILGTISDAGFVIAIARGYFTDVGINIERTSIPSGPDAIQFLATGQLDVLGGGPGVGLYNAFAVGSRLRVVADKGHAGAAPFGLAPVLVRRDLYESGQLRDYSQFGGRRVALSGPGGTNRVDLNKMLERGGLSEADVEIVPMSFPDMIPAVANGSVDLAIAIEPSATAGVERGAAIRLGTTADVYPNHQAGMLMFSEALASERREVAQRYMVAYVRGLRDYNNAFRAGKDKAEIIEILGAATNVTDPALYDKMALPGLNPDGYAFKDSLSEDQDWFLRLGLQREPVNIDQLVDNQYVDYAIQQLGRYQPPP